MVKSLPKTVKASANETAVLECQVDSAGITSFWMKDGKRLDVDEGRPTVKYEMTSEAMTHQLKVNKLSSTDSGLYTFVAGSAKSHTTIYVEGRIIIAFELHCFDVRKSNYCNIFLKIKYSKFFN